MSLLAGNLDLLMFAALCAGILLGYPVVFTLAGIGVLFGALGWTLGVFNPGLLQALSQRVFQIMTNEVLLAIPLFVLMGVILERSKIAEELLEEMGKLFGALRGGLAVSVTVVGMLLAASTGIVGATVVTMALIALPTMLRNGYDTRLAVGAVTSAGTLGQIIPPSTMLIILAEVMSSSYQQAQFEQGKFTVETISVGQIFAASLLPGLMLVGLYIGYILIVSWWKPDAGPALKIEGEAIAPRDWWRFLRVLITPVALIVAVLGSILGGIATPTEAASVGAMGALLLAGLKLSPEGRRWPVYATLAALVALLLVTGSFDLRVARHDIGSSDQAAIYLAVALIAVIVAGLALCFWRAGRGGILKPVVDQTLTVTCMIFAMLIGASMFSLVFRGLGGDVRVEEFLTNMPGAEISALLFVMALIFVMGFFLDFVEISVIVLPIVVPILLLMGMDPIWLSVMIAINLQTSFMTPPFGFSLFYLRGAAPPEVRTIDIYRGVIPFVALNLFAILLIYFVPEVGTTLPRLFFG